MKNYILSGLFAGCLLGCSLHAQPMGQAMQQDGMRGPNMMQQMMREFTEEDLFEAFNDQEINLYQQLSPQQKALFLKAVNQFSCKAQMQMMRQRMMHQRMMQQEMMNR